MTQVSIDAENEDFDAENEDFDIECDLADILGEELKLFAARIKGERPFRRTKAKVVYDR